MNTKQLSSSIDNPFFVDLVVFPLGKKDTVSTSPSHFFVEEVDKTLTASTDPMPGLSTSFEVHASQLLGKVLANPSQPMLRIASAKRRDYMLQRGGEPEADGKPRSHHSYRAPELLGVEPLYSGLWRQAQALPWLLHRMEGLLHALPLADVKALPPDMVLAQVLFLSWLFKKCSFVQEDSGEPENLSDLMPRLLGEEIGPGPTPGHLVHALTLAAAGDRFFTV